MFGLNAARAERVRYQSRDEPWSASSSRRISPLPERQRRRHRRLATAHDEIDCAGMLQPAFAGHDSEPADAPIAINTKTFHSAAPTRFRKNQVCVNTQD